MKGHTFMDEYMDIVDNMDIDAFLQEFAPEVIPDFSPDTRSLDQLPSELIGMIAEHLPKEDLYTLQALGSRTILQAIDHVFAEANFSRRRCRSTITSVARLEALSHSRFAKHIRTLEIHFLLECQPSNSLQYGLAVQSTRSHCIVADISVAEKFGGIFRRIPNLRSATIRAPLGLPGMLDTCLLHLPSATTGPHTHDLQFRVVHPQYLQAHSHILHTCSIFRLTCGLVSAMRVVSQQLENFQIIGYADSIWQSALMGNMRPFSDVCELPALQNLTSLNLQLEMFTFHTNLAITRLVHLLKSNANLKALALSEGPLSIRRYQKRNENWAPLLQLLGSNPPFSLRSLEINGLVTSTTAPTLSCIIDLHSRTIRRVILENTNFHYPNTLRAFFTACANSDICYYKSRNFYFHERAMIVSSSLAYDTLEDEDERLHEHVEDWGKDSNHCNLDDKSCRDWVEVDWAMNDYPRNTVLIYDNEDGRKGIGYMHGAFMSAASMVKDGAIIDS